MVGIKVTLVSRDITESIGQGVPRYSYMLYRGLRQRGLDVDKICSSSSSSSVLRTSFDIFVYLPLRVLKPFPSSDIYHFTSQQIGLVTPIFKGLYRKKLVTTVHDIHHQLMPKMNKASILYQKAAEAAVKYSDIVIVDASLIKEDLVEHFDADKDKIRVVPLGVDEKFRKIKRPENEKFTVGYLGSFSPNKSVPFLVRSYGIFEKNNPGISKLVLYGEGPQLEECKSLARSLGIRNIEFRGFAPERDIVKIYNSFDVYVFPSTMEGFGFPILEAQKCGVPVLVREGVHVPDELTRYCLRAKDEESMAQLLENVYRKKFVFSDEHMRYLSGFSWEACISRTLDVYSELLGGDS